MINHLILRELRPKDRRHRAIIYLYYDYGYTQKEIGELMGISQQLVSRIKIKAINRMRKHILN